MTLFRLFLIASVALAGVTARADTPPSVLVETQPARRGSVPNVVIAYGTVGPAVGGGMTLSLQQDGRVLAIAVTPGEQVRQGERLMDFGASAAASSTYQQAVSALALARTQRTHAAQLLSQQLATRDQLAQADKAVADAQAAVDALRREGAGQAEQTLVAPFDGIVATIPVAQGDRIQPSAPLLTLTHLDGLVVTVGIEPGDRLRIPPQAPVRLERLQPGPALDGHVLRVDAVLNPKTRQLDADISLPVGAAISGEAFRAVIRVGDIAGWMVPRNAVLIDGSGAYLFQANGDKAARVNVKLAGSAGDTDVVEGNLDPSRQVIVQGANQLDDGATIRTSAPAASQPGHTL